MARGFMTDAAALSGVGLIGYGLWLVHPSLVFIVGGLALLGASVWWTWPKGKKP